MINEQDTLITFRKGRTIDLSKQVKVYRNLHHNCYSIKQNNLVVAHAEEFQLSNATFTVNQKNRERVITTKQKNVHAFIKGYYHTKGTIQPNVETPTTSIYYNAYETSSFIDRESRKPLQGAVIVNLNKTSVTAILAF